MNATLMDATRAMGGQLAGKDAPFAGVSIDTRTLDSDALFFAVSGPNFDGHDFLQEAAAKGAAAAVVSRRSDEPISQIVVEDTRAALGKLGRAWRDSHNVLAVGITGSNGKTTLKELIGACLRGKAETLVTEGNLNNDLGVPLMLMRLGGKHRYGVFEMGANHAGEIAYLTSLVKPAVVVLSNAGPAHLEGFGSLDGVARAKGEILEGQPRPECAVLNADDHYFEYWQSLVSDTDSLSFGLSDNADVYASDIELAADSSRFELHLQGEVVAVHLPLAGVHNVRNACAAAAVVSRLSLDAKEIAAGLAAVNIVGGRLRPVAGPNGSRLFDDSYNANPTSVAAAAEFVAALDGTSILVLGDMLELGGDAEAIHRRLGHDLCKAGVDRILATGPLSKNTVSGFGDKAAWYDSVETLSTALRELIAADSNVLVKGSRSTRMERVVESLLARDEEAC